MTDETEVEGGQLRKFTYPSGMILALAIDSGLVIMHALSTRGVPFTLRPLGAPILSAIGSMWKTSDIYGKLSYIIDLCLPSIWIALYYYGLTNWLAPILTQGVCREEVIETDENNKKTHKLRFVSAISGMEVNSINWPITVPIVAFLFFCYAAPFMHVVWLHAWAHMQTVFHALGRLLVGWAVEGGGEKWGSGPYRTDSVAITLGRTLGMPPSGDAGADGTTEWEKNRHRFIRRMSTMHKEGKIMKKQSDIGYEYDTYGKVAVGTIYGVYAAPTDPVHYEVAKPAIAGHILENTGGCWKNHQPQDAHSLMIMLVTMVSSVLAYSGGEDWSADDNAKDGASVARKVVYFNWASVGMCALWYVFNFWFRTFAVSAAIGAVYGIGIPFFRGFATGGITPSTFEHNCVDSGTQSHVKKGKVTTNPHWVDSFSKMTDFVPEAEWNKLTSDEGKRCAKWDLNVR